MSNQSVQIDIVAELRESISLNKMLLNSISVGFTSLSIVSGIIFPVLWQDRNVLTSLFLGNITSGILVIASSKKLSEVDKDGEVLEIVKEQNFLHHATSHALAIQDTLTDAYGSFNQPPYMSLLTQFPSVSQNAVNPQEVALQGLQQPEIMLQNSSLQDAGSIPDNLSLEVIVEALNRGIADSKIIEEIMGFKGRNYQEGKKYLEMIKRRCIISQQEQTTIEPVIAMGV